MRSYMGVWWCLLGVFIYFYRIWACSHSFYVCFPICFGPCFECFHMRLLSFMFCFHFWNSPTRAHKDYVCALILASIQPVCCIFIQPFKPHSPCMQNWMTKPCKLSWDECQPWRLSKCWSFKRDMPAMRSSHDAGAGGATFMDGEPRVLQATAGAHGEDLPATCIAGGPNPDDHGTHVGSSWPKMLPRWKIWSCWRLKAWVILPLDMDVEI